MSHFTSRARDIYDKFGLRRARAVARRVQRLLPPLRPGRRRLTERQRLLASGDEVEVPCRLRRTSARGWGPWVAGSLRLAGGDQGAGGDFIADDPTQASLVTGRSARPGPIPVTPPVRLDRRPVRFKREAFFGFGGGAQVLVLVSSRSTTEIAVSATEVDAVARRLADT